jgi:hypothetical protein
MPKTKRSFSIDLENQQWLQANPVVNGSHFVNECLTKARQCHPLVLFDDDADDHAGGVPAPQGDG